jgi:hypothetical protein
MAFAPTSPVSASVESRRTIGMLLLFTGLGAVIAGTTMPTLYAAGGLAAAAFMGVAAWSPRYGLYLLVVYAELAAGFVKILAGGSYLAAAVVDLMSLLVLVAAVIQFGIPTLRTALDKLVVLFIPLVLLMAVLNPAAPGGLQLAGGIRTLILYLPFYFVARALVPTRRDEHRLVALLLAGAAVLGLISAVQYKMGPDWAQSHHLATRVVLDWGASAGGYRPSSMFPLPGVAGMFFAAMLVLNTAVLLRPEGRYRGRYILTALPIVFGLMASGQRAALLGCGFAMLVLAILTRSRRLVGVLLLATAALVASAVIGVGPSRVTSGVAGNNAHSTQTRFKTWTSVAEQLPTFPFGHGPGYTGSSAYRFGSRVGATPRVVSDNYWVKQLWEMGVLGALWYTAVLALAALAALRLFRAARPESGAVALAVCGLIAQQASASWFTNALDPSPYNLIFWLFVGLARMPSREDVAEAEVFGQVSEPAPARLRPQNAAV